MKQKRSQNKLLLMLNKQTIANLNPRQQRRIKVGEAAGGAVVETDYYGLTETEETADCTLPQVVSPNCSPEDTGITPEELNGIRIF